MARPIGAPKLKRDGPRYKIVWRDPVAKRTRQKSLGEMTPAAAHASFAEFLAKIEAGDRAAEPKAKASLDTVAEVLDYYAANKGEDHSFRPLRNLLGGVRLGDIDLAACEDYDRNRAPCAGGTVRRELAMLTAAVNYCAKRRLVLPGNMPSIEKPPAGEPRSRWLSKEELDSLLKAAARHYFPRQQKWMDCVQAPPTRVYCFTSIAYWTGARREAVETLQWDQVDLKAGVINFNIPGRRRTKKRRAVISIPAKLRPLLEELQRHRSSPHVLGHPGSIRRSFENAVKRAGLEGVTRHTLRHTRATHLLRAGTPISQVANFLGHSIPTLLKNYAHSLPHGLPEDL